MYTPNTKFNLISTLKSEITTATTFSLHGDLIEETQMMRETDNR